MSHNGHVHDENCNHEHDDVQMITLTLDDNTELDCFVIGIFDVDEQDYIALLPQEEEEVFLYRYAEVDGEVQLDNIENEEEYEKVSGIFVEMMENDAFDFDDDDFDDDDFDDDDFDDDDFDDDDYEEDEEE